MAQGSGAEGAAREPNYFAKDLYARVGVSPYAATGEINERIRSLIHKYHEDRNPHASKTEKERNTKIVQQLLEAKATLTKARNRAAYDVHRPFDPRGEIVRRRNEETYARRKAEDRARREAEERREQEEAARKAEEERRRAEAADAREAAARAARAQNGANAGQANGTGAGATPPPAAGETKTEDKDMKGADATPQETAAEAEERQVRESLERQREEWRKQREAAAAAGEAAPPPGGNTAGENTASPPDPAEQQKLHDLEQLRTDRHNLNESYLNILKEKHLGSSSEAADIEAQRIFHERQDIELELLRRGRAAAEKAAREKEQAERERQAREQAEAAAKEAEAREAEAKAKQEQEQREREAADKVAREAQAAQEREAAEKNAREAAEREAAERAANAEEQARREAEKKRVEEEAQKEARAAENRHSAESVHAKYEDDVLYGMKLAHDPFWKLLNKIARDPAANFKMEEAGLYYRVVTPGTPGNVQGQTARTYHDVLRMRAGLSEAFRAEHDHKVWNRKDSGKSGKIGLFANTAFTRRLNDPNDPLARYVKEFSNLYAAVENEQLPDDYAAAVASGDIDRSVVKMQQGAFSRLKTVEAARDEFYERTKNRQKTPEEEAESSRLIDEEFETKSRLERLLSVTDPYEPDPFETAPLNDPAAARAREKELWRELYGIRDKKFESLENYKRHERLVRQWSGLRTKLEEAGELEGDEPEGEGDPSDPRHRKDPHAGSADEFVGPPRPDSRAEWRKNISSMIGKIYEGIRQPSEMYKKGKEYLGQRLKDIDRDAISVGAENFARKAGETYNKLPWWGKLAFGAGVAGTMAFTWPVSTVAGMACGGLLGLQRAAGMFGLFVKMEKGLLDARAANLAAGKRTGFVGRFAFDSEKANTNQAAGLAMAYMVGAGGGIGLGVRAAADWMADYYYSNITEALPARGVGPSASGTSAQPTTPGGASSTPDGTTSAPEGGASSTGAQPAPSQTAPASGGQAAGTEGTPPSAGGGSEGLQISVEATKGKGYEWMAKRAWEGVQELKQQGLEASELKPGSDMERLYNADASEIDKIVHDIARTRGFYKEDGGTNFRLALGDKLTFNAEGKLELVRGDERFERPPEGSKFTSRYEPGARVGSAPLAEGARPSMAVPGAEPGTFINQNPDAPGVPPEVRAMFRGVETPIEAAPAEELLRQTLPEREPVVGVDLTSQAPASEVPTPQDVPPPPASEAVQPATEQPATSAPVSPEQAPAQEIVTQAGERVNLKEPRLFEIEGGRPFFFGGTAQEQYDALAKHLKGLPLGQEAVAYAPDANGEYVIGWTRNEDGSIETMGPVYKKGFLGIFNSLMKVPAPDQFLRVIK